MEEKQKSIILIVILLAATVVLLICTFWMLSPQYEAVVNQHESISGSDTTAVYDLKVNINSADIDTLMRLPEMTEEIAIGIIEHRELYQRFFLMEDLKEVQGVTDSLYDLWYPYIVL